MSRRRPLRTPRLRGRVAAVAAAMALACLTATPASADTVPNGAVATFNSVSRISAAGMGFQSDTGREAGRVSAFESAHPALRRVKAADVLAAPDGALTGRALCHPSNIAGAQGFCWNTTDDATGAWTPQGLTGSGESPSHRPWSGAARYSSPPGTATAAANASPSST